MLKLRELKIEVGNTLTKKDIAKKLKVEPANIISYEIKKESLDARDKNKIYFVYEVNVKLKDENIKLSNNVTKVLEKHYEFPKSDVKDANIIVVGSGPAGLFSSYLLAENGYKVTLLERGSKVEERIKKVEEFWKSGKLDSNSNVQFGEGGAGTFSDGKLNTLVKDEEKRGEKVYETFVKFGAPKEILYSYKPHIGTNILRTVIKNMRMKMIEMGVTFEFDTCLTDIEIEKNKIKSITANNKKYKPDILVLALGHSARDTFMMLKEKNINMEAKPFAVGFRIEHPQKMIDESQYGLKYAKYLEKATYKLTYKSSNNRGVYSFCMCPGGYVVNASSEYNRLAINGMSNYERESKNANSAIVVTVKKEDFENEILKGMEFQRQIEEKAYNLKKGKIPVQLLKDYLENKETKKLGEVEVITKGEYEFANLNEILPNYLNDAIKEALPYFGKKIKGFDRSDAILFGVESRTSSPVRIIRDENCMSNIEGLFPCGEGAGYAGGITSAAMDGIKVAEEIHKYLNRKKDL